MHIAQVKFSQHNITDKLLMSTIQIVDINISNCGYQQLSISIIRITGIDNSCWTWYPQFEMLISTIWTADIVNSARHFTQLWWMCITGKEERRKYHQLNTDITNSNCVSGVLSLCIFSSVRLSVPVFSFYPRDAMLERVFATATCLSVCPSVCHTPVLCLAERKQHREMYTIW